MTAFSPIAPYRAMRCYLTSKFKPLHRRTTVKEFRIIHGKFDRMTSAEREDRDLVDNLQKWSRTLYHIRRLNTVWYTEKKLKVKQVL